MRSLLPALVLATIVAGWAAQVRITSPGTRATEGSKAGSPRSQNSRAGPVG